jgi:hypothetical protein
VAEQCTETGAHPPAWEAPEEGCCWHSQLGELVHSGSLVQPWQSLRIVQQPDHRRHRRVYSCCGRVHIHRLGRLRKRGVVGIRSLEDLKTLPDGCIRRVEIRSTSIRVASESCTIRSTSTETLSTPTLGPFVSTRTFRKSGSTLAVFTNRATVLLAFAAWRI